tara:strand:- start:3071 stop:3379 length:309 start_codon:yes stop_codon:yes gene_type:complete
MEFLLITDPKFWLPTYNKNLTRANKAIKNALVKAARGEDPAKVFGPDPATITKELWESIRRIAVLYSINLNCTDAQVCADIMKYRDFIVPQEELNKAIAVLK